MQSTPLTNSADLSTVIHAMEQNLIRMMTYFCRHAPKITIDESPELTVVHSTIPDSTYNFVIHTRLNTAQTLEKIRQVKKIFTKLHTPFSWWVCPFDSPSNINEFFEQESIHLVADDPGMLINLDGYQEQPLPSPLTFKSASSQEDLKEFAAINCDAGESGDFYSVLLESLPQSCYGAHSDARLFTGSVNGKAVTSGMILFSHGIAGIYYIATRPQEQGKGYASAMMRHLLRTAVEAGYHLATLQASKAGASLYKKLGFVEVANFQEYIC